MKRILGAAIATVVIASLFRVAAGDELPEAHARPTPTVVGSELPGSAMELPACAR